MKKPLPIVIAILLIVGAIFMVTQGGDNANDKQAGTPSQTQPDIKEFSPSKACDLLTLDDAKKVLGENIELTELPGGGGASSDDIEVSQCVYSQAGADTIDSIRAQKQASILVRGAKTQKGADSNEVVFKGSQKPAEAQDVSGYGDGAFWNPQFGQFNILKNNNWYILTSGVTSPSEKTLDEAKALADIIIDKL